MIPKLPAAFLSRPLAHRALHDRAAGRIENSLSAVQAAVLAGYGIEIDVQLSRDGQAMVFHDETLDRLTDAKGAVAARDAAELGQIALRDGLGDTIPTLAQVLAAVAGRVPLLIEIKDQSLTLTETDGRLETATVAALQGYAGDVALMSFNPHAVAHVARLAPHLPRGLTTDAFDADEWQGVAAETCARLRAIPDYNAVGASFLSHDWHDLTRPRVTELAQQGAEILCWTVKSPEAEAVARQTARNITFEGYAAPFPA
ncbi:glycerophosphodiester phosphodiesterase family protein [Neogemmobacter tilapiae]|uniref:Phosphodiesterase n=1 Tax=Neogemmobacter tilapiae TaxID=875041 RepID=A0A918TT86_9RHOB|nr:glycerophosphodiester phosphodiesterase family protein [Gemmobacter tilapiae]GHC55604.1 phosphodiesterase [Gemmobacter tilapiae]